MPPPPIKIIKGTDLKYHIQIECAGFDIEDDEFCCIIRCGSIAKAIPKTEMVIGDDGFYVTTSTADFPCAPVTLTVLAQVPDPDFPNGTRLEKARITLCQIIE